MLTEKQIQALKPREKDFVLSDGRTARGEGVLVLKVRPSGNKEFYFQRHVAGKKKMEKLGTWPGMKLTVARDKCREEKEKKVSAGTFQELIDFYVGKLDVEGAATAADVKWSLKHYVSEPFPDLVGKPASQIGPTHIRDIIARMIGVGITTYCNRVRSQLHAAFQAGLEQEYNPRNYLDIKVRFGLASNPVASVPVQDDWEQPGDRALSTEELATLWQLLPEHLSLVTAELLKFLIASGGQRPEQVLATARVHYMKDHMIIRNRKGKSRGKGVEGERALHVVPFNKLMRQSLRVMEEVSGASAFPFAGKAEGKSLHTQSLSRAVTKLYGRHTEKFSGPFTLRDIRRTCKTLMGVAGLDKELKDRIQGHAFGDVGSKHYDRYTYFKEKKKGMQKWSLWLHKNCIKSSV
jgi:hypothetical protein